MSNNGEDKETRKENKENKERRRRKKIITTESHTTNLTRKEQIGI
jgi:hypothetical protein